MLPRLSLTLGNFATGMSILAPAGMLAMLADGLGVGIREAGLLVTFGAMVLCICSPLMAWLTTRIDRRILLVGALGVIVAGQAASAFAPNYTMVLALRLIMLSVAAIYTPQAASTIALIVPAKERSSAISFVFLGWSLAIAGGLPMIAFVAGYAGWRIAFAACALLALIPAILLVFALPRGLQSPPLSLGSFGTLARNHKIVQLLLITILQTAGQFTVFIYLAPLLVALTGASHEAVGAMFALFGIAGFIGNVIATRIVGPLGAWLSSGLWLGSIFVGMSLWAFGAGWLPVMAVGVVFWGFGFAAINSMQQARLAAAVPGLSSASIALNTSSLYVGQAIGSGIGGLLFGLGAVHGIGFVGVALLTTGIVLWAFSRDRPAAASA